MFLLRVLLGLIFFLQGFGKVFSWGVGNVYANAFSPYEVTFLPKVLLKITAYYTSYVELIFGLLIIIGLFRRWSYLALGSVLVIVTFGHGVKDPIWDLHHVLFRAALLVPLMLLPQAWDRWVPKIRASSSRDNE